MSRKVITFSLPEAEEAKLQDLLGKNGLTRSQFLRQLLDSYASVSRGGDAPKKDLAQLLRSYWDIKASTAADIKIIGLAIVRNRDNQVLIVSRQPDATIEGLTWAFPGSGMNSLDFSSELRRSIHERTNQEVVVGGLMAARIIPDATLNEEQIIALYFDCISQGGDVSISSPYTDYKWVNPLDVFRHFTTSTSDEVTKYLSSLQHLR